VDAKYEDHYIHLGNCIYRVHENRFLDFAVVKVNDNNTGHCSTELVRPTQIELARNWKFSFTPPVPRSKVYKQGFGSSHTDGLIIGTDNLSKDIAECYKDLVRSNGCDNAETVFQILIESPQENSPGTCKYFCNVIYTGTRTTKIASMRC